MSISNINGYSGIQATPALYPGAASYQGTGGNSNLYTNTFAGAQAPQAQAYQPQSIGYGNYGTSQPSAPSSNGPAVGGAGATPGQSLVAQATQQSKAMQTQQQYIQIRTQMQTQAITAQQNIQQQYQAMEETLINNDISMAQSVEGDMEKHLQKAIQNSAA